MSGKSEVRVSCTDQVLKITESPVIASGGLNEVSVIFSFCEKWDGFVKTAIFYRDEENVYYAVLDENDTCVVPWEVCYEEGTFYFSVFGEKADKRRTASVVRYKVKKGAITTDMLPSDPTPAVYDQIMALVAEAIERSKSFKAEAEEVIEAAQQATDSALIATEEANTSAANARKATADAVTATENANTAAANAIATASVAANDAISIANNAASNANAVANQAAERANTAASNADVAKANAITATNNANSATNKANAAADSANNATANANTATARANNSARDADTAASNAITATSNANQATQNANNAANNANAEAGKATQAAADANTATTEANTAASEARAATEETNTARETFLQDAGEILSSLSGAVYATPIECAVTGDVIAVKDASNQQLAGLNIYGKTTQNGTPTPTSPVPLKSAGESGAVCVTVKGKNLCPPVKAGAYNGNTGAFLPQYPNDRCTEKIPIVKGQTYTQSNNSGMLPTNTFLWDADGTYIGKAPKNNTYVSEYDGYIAFEYGENDVQWVQLEEGNSVTAYEPYKGQTLTVSTPNGLHGIGDVCDEIDFARGIRVQRIGKIVDDGTLTFYKSPSQFTTGATRFDCISNKYPLPIVDNDRCLCSHYLFKGANIAESTWIAVDGGKLGLRIVTADFDNATDLNAYLTQQRTNGNPLTWYYELAQPIETPLTAEELASYAALHSNKPNTTVFNDGGAGLKLAYNADTKLYIDNKINELATAILNNA
jgi:hypothetical protein